MGFMQLFSWLDVTDFGLCKAIVCVLDGPVSGSLVYLPSVANIFCIQHYVEPFIVYMHTNRC